jgi:hypothetical protein
VIQINSPGQGWSSFQVECCFSPRALASTIAVPALVLAGGAGPQSLQPAAKATADALPTAEHRTLDGQTHDVAPDALAPVLAEFFGT